MAETVKDGTMADRDTKGRFVAGNRASPGRPKLEFSLTEMLRAEVSARPTVVKRLIALANSDDERVAIEAIKTILNRLEPQPRDGGASATAIAQVVNIIRGGDDLGMLP